METASTKYSFSRNEEIYEGTFDSLEAVCDEAAANLGVGATFWVGEQQSPMPPENLWDAELWLEHVACQDDYSGECAEDWGRATKMQRQELEDQIRPILAAWLDRHRLRPNFWTIANPRRFFVAQKVGEVYEIEALT